MIFATFWGYDRIGQLFAYHPKKRGNDTPPPAIFGGRNGLSARQRFHLLICNPLNAQVRFFLNAHLHASTLQRCLYECFVFSIVDYRCTLTASLRELHAVTFSASIYSPSAHHGKHPILVAWYELTNARWIGTYASTIPGAI